MDTSRSLTVNTVAERLPWQAVEGGAKDRTVMLSAQLLESGVDIRIIQVLLGHNSLSTTAHYTQVATTTIARTQSPLDRLTLEVAPPA